MNELPRPIGEMREIVARRATVIRRRRRLLAVTVSAIAVLAGVTGVWALSGHDERPTLQPLDAPPTAPPTTFAPTETSNTGVDTPTAADTAAVSDTSAPTDSAAVADTSAASTPGAPSTTVGPTSTDGIDRGPEESTGVTNASVPVDPTAGSALPYPPPAGPDVSGADVVGAPLPVDYAASAPHLVPAIVGTVDAGSVSVDDTGLFSLVDGVVHVYDFAGTEVRTVPLDATFDSWGALYAGPDGAFYVDHFRLPAPDSGSVIPTRLVTVFDGSGRQIDEGVVTTDIGGESAPFLAFGVEGLVDRMLGKTVVAYQDGIDRQAAPQQDMFDVVPGIDEITRGDASWTIPVVRHPNAANLYAGETWPAADTNGGAVMTRWIGPDIEEGQHDFGTPSDLVLIRMQAGESADWFRIDSEWFLVGSVEGRGTLLARPVAVDGVERLQIGWVFGTG